MIAIPIVLIILPANFFDGGETICLSQHLFEMECPGCGMTRAIMYIIHFNFFGAWELNKMSFIVFPIISFLWAKEFISELKFLNQKVTEK